MAPRRKDKVIVGQVRPGPEEDTSVNPFQDLRFHGLSSHCIPGYRSLALPAVHREDPWTGMRLSGPPSHAPLLANGGRGSPHTCCISLLNSSVTAVAKIWATNSALAFSNRLTRPWIFADSVAGSF